MVVNKDGHFRKFIIAHKCFQGDNLVKRRRGQNGIFGSQQLTFRLVAFVLSPLLFTGSFLEINCTGDFLVSHRYPECRFQQTGLV
jgi:ssDNA-binding Zn-finger/Zn-ribbon topoisomerase 1